LFFHHLERRVWFADHLASRFLDRGPIWRRMSSPDRGVRTSGAFAGRWVVFGPRRSRTSPPDLQSGSDCMKDQPIGGWIC